MLDFQTLFQENNQFIFRYLMKLSGNESLAEELTQETFFRAYINLSALRNEEKVSAWLCQIAKNAYFTWFNEQKKYKPAEESLLIECTPDIADIFEEKELADKAFSVMYALDRPYKEVFILAIFGGLSLKAISSMFGKSESWARVTYYRAKQKILEGLDQNYGL